MQEISNVHVLFRYRFISNPRQRVRMLAWPSRVRAAILPLGGFLTVADELSDPSSAEVAR